jgi:GNAT superfamily N-acetyltransferase
VGTEIQVYPATHERWEDLESLFGPRGACGGCWCMWWRLVRSEYERCKGEKNRRSLMGLVRGGRIPGLLAYRGGDPVAWVSLGPRESFTALERSRILKRVDEEPVWSIVCFYIPRAQRGKGLTGRLLEAAIEYVRGLRVPVLEAYPIDPKGKRVVDAFAYTGFASTFTRAGFVEAARRSPARPIMRLSIGGKN